MKILVVEDEPKTASYLRNGLVENGFVTDVSARGDDGSASGRLLIVVPIALFLIFILLFSAFGSVRDALIVYTGVPFAVVGGCWRWHFAGCRFQYLQALCLSPFSALRC